MRKRIRFYFWLSCFSLITASAMLGQTGTTTIAGNVVDTSGAALYGAKVQVSTRSTVTDSQGRFFLTDVSPGVYDVTITYVGFMAFSKTVTATAGEPAEISATLKVASKAGYAYSDDLSPEKIRKAARVAARSRRRSSSAARCNRKSAWRPTR